jgi:cyclophilin family peptidyl-prolyl cis-trans isomerase
MRRGLVALLLLVASSALWPAFARAGEFVRFSTSLGNIDVQLLPQDAPNSVANFLSYVNSGAYSSTFFHRLVSGFVLQGGGYDVEGGQIATIPTQAPVANEFSVSNTRGTLAMAQAGGNPNSATDQWFFNLTDNSSQLDKLHFTVFGQVLDPSSLSVMDAIAQLRTTTDEPAPLPSGDSQQPLPVQNYTGGTASVFNLVMSPIAILNDTTPPAITITQPVSGEQLALGQSVASSFSCDDGNGTGVKSCSGPATVKTSLIGQQTFTVTATDYAGNTTTQTVNYDVVGASIVAGGGTAGGPPSTPVTPTTPPAHASPLPSLVAISSTIRPSTISITLRCAGNSRCAGQATLSELQPNGRRTALGSVRYSIPAGKRVRLSLALTAAGRSLLRHTTRKLRVSLSLLPTGGKAHTTTSQAMLAVDR